MPEVYNTAIQTIPGNFGNTGDYLVLKINSLQAAGSIGTSYRATLSEENIFLQAGAAASINVTTLNRANSQFVIYQNVGAEGSDNIIYIKPNEILSSSAVPDGDYILELSGFNQYKPQISEIQPFSNFINPQFDNIDETHLASLPFPQFFEEFDINSDGDLSLAGTTWADNYGRPDIQNYLNELLEIEQIPYYFGEAGFDAFHITEISNTRLEARIKLYNTIIDDGSFAKSHFINEVGDPTSEKYLDDEGTQDNPNYNPFKYSHIIYNLADQVDIVNYVFDTQKEGVNNQSIVLKFSDPLPVTFNRNDTITIEKKVILPYSQTVKYFSDIPPVPIGDGLTRDSSELYIDTDSPTQNVYQNYDQLSASLSPEVLDSLITGSKVDYKNLNIDYRFFGNHTFFGSAKRKLENFKNKVETIQGYHSEISKSLSAPGITQESSSDNLIADRNTKFNKIQEEINSFTPYERFLYFDGQSESTASAPGVGKNYVSKYAVKTKTGYGASVDLNTYNAESKFLGKKDGLPLVYKITQSIDQQSNTLFFRSSNIEDDNQYRLENKPFFSYSSSVYLSFMIKGNQAFHRSTGSSGEPNLQHVFNPDPYNIDGAEIYTPRDAFFSSSILKPSLTGSEYRRYIFHSSGSYWQPALETTGEPPVVDNNLNFGLNSGDIEVLSGSIKTGSHPIKTDGPYQNLSTYTAPSGAASMVAFTGSMVPMGDLFKVRAFQPYISHITASWNVDFSHCSSGSNITEAMLSSSDSGSGALNTLNTGSIPSANKPMISDGLIAHRRQYGKSMYFQSGSTTAAPFDAKGGTTIRFKSDQFNFSKSGSFSLSIWAKRFHRETGSEGESADAAGNDSNANQRLIGRGSYANSYGIEYNQHYNQIRACTRTGSSGAQNCAQFEMPDDGLNWHHYAMTFTSGSATGLKLYVDGALKAKKTTLNMFTGSSDTSTADAELSTTASINDNTENLNLGGGNVVGGNSYGFNGYLQYPRVYSKELTQNEVHRLYLAPDGILESELTDIKINFENPLNAQPFSQLYHTSSTQWTDWYNGMYTSASNFDTDNIHSLENNLPSYIQESSEYGDLKQFLSLQGEKYDIIRNHIDTMGSIHNRNYKKLDSVPSNTLPMILENFGYNAINPFSSSLAQHFGQFESSATNVQDITDNTYRKTLNNLIYIYKSKGTKNAVRGLMNIHGYPPDLLNVSEFGGANEPQNDSPLKTTASIGTKIYDTDLGRNIGNVQFVSKKGKLYHYRFNKNSNRTLQTDWWMDNVNANTIQLVYKHHKSTNTQELLKSSGSGTENLWDLRLIPDNEGISSSLQFRLNNSKTGSLDITGSAISMSLGYNTMLDGQLWNIMLQRMSSSVSGSGTQEYRLYSALQDDRSPDIIYNLSHMSMSVSGGLTEDSNNLANQNWVGSGSRHYLTSSNLYVGRTLTGSMAELRTWTTTLSASRFRMHTLNKFSTVGNTISSHQNELIYRFRLNENYISSSISGSTQTTVNIVDSAPKYALTTDYTFTISSNLVTSSALYGYDIIDAINVGLQDANQLTVNDNKILINPSTSLIRNLSPDKKSTKSLYERHSRTKRTTSTRLEINRSPQNFINNFILEKIQGFNLETLYGNPQNRFSSSYSEFDTFRETFFDNYPIVIDTNKFIRYWETVFNPSIIDGIYSISPARANLNDRNSSVGVTIKPTILEKQKYEHHRAGIEVNPNKFSASIYFINTPSSSYFNTHGYQHGFTLSGSYILPKSASLNVNNIISFTGSKYEAPKSASLNVNNVISLTESKYEAPKSASISMISSLEYLPSGSDGQHVSGKTRKSLGMDISGSHIKPRSGSILHTDFISLTSSYVAPYSGSISSPHKFNEYYENISDAQKAGARIAFQQSASNDNEITLTSFDGEGLFTTKTYRAMTNSTNGTLSGSFNATASMRFNQSASNNAKITLTAWDGSSLVTRTYMALSSSTNGTLSGSAVGNTGSRVVLFSTGSGGIFPSSSAATNLAAAITSSNGHGSTLFVSHSDKGILTITQSVDGTRGNTSLSYADNIHLSLAASASSFIYGASNVVLFSTGSGAGGIFQSSSAAANLAAAITSSNGHGTKFTVSQLALSSTSGSGNIIISQSVAGSDGNTIISSSKSISGEYPSASEIFIGGTNSNKKLYKPEPYMVSLSGSKYISPQSASIPYTHYTSLTGSEIITPRSASILYSSMVSLTESKVTVPVSGTIDYISKATFDGFRDLHKEWGTGSNDTHFLNMATLDRDTGSYSGGEYNVNHIESRYHFYSIGDVETYSGSAGSGSFNVSEFNNKTRFYNRQIISDGLHINMTYESYIGPNKGSQVGRAIGKTRYYSSSIGSDGTLSEFYPSNHVKNYSNPWLNRMYEGTQISNAGIMSLKENEDYATASFYRVKVTGGENQLIVRGGKLSKDDNDKII